MIPSDTGGNAEIFEHNVKALGVDLSKLDFVVISHRHDRSHQRSELSPSCYRPLKYLHFRRSVGAVRLGCVEKFVSLR